MTKAWRRWTPDEDALLKRLVEDGVALVDIVPQLEHSLAAIKVRAWVLIGSQTPTLHISYQSLCQAVLANYGSLPMPQMVDLVQQWRPSWTEKDVVDFACRLRWRGAAVPLLPRRWTPEQIDQLRVDSAQATVPELAAKYHLTIPSMWTLLHRLGIKRRRQN